MASSSLPTPTSPSNGAMTTSEAPSTPFVCPFGVRNVDVVFVVESSLIMGPVAWMFLRQYVHDVVELLDVGVDATRYALA
jgi:hypothetical protein